MTERPTMLGRLPLLVMLVMWLASPPIAIVLAMRGEMTAPTVALVVFVALSVVLSIAPGILVLGYRWRHRDEPLPRRLRRAGIGSGIATTVTGVFIWYLGAATDERSVMAGGVACAIIGVVTAIALLASPKRTDTLEPVGVSPTHVVAATIFALGAIIAIPKFGCACGSKSTAYRAEMKSDLRNLVYAEESYFADSAHYTTDLAAMHMRMSSGVNAPTIVLQGKAGWTATVTHSQLMDEMCGIAVGGKNPIDDARPEGEPACGSPR